MGLSHQTKNWINQFHTAVNFLGAFGRTSVLAILKTARCDDHKKIDNKQQAIIQNLIIGPIIQKKFILFQNYLSMFLIWIWSVG